MSTWFKNLQIFQLVEPIEFAPEALAESIADSQFVPCSKSSAKSIGFYPPTGNIDAPLVYGANGFMMLSLKIQEKVLPPSVIREELAIKIKDMEAKESRKISYKEKSRIKEDLTQDLIMRAFCKSSFLFAVIDTKHNWLLINTSSTTKAELFVNTLRDALGHLKAQLPEVTSPGLVLTHWLKAQAAEGFTIENFCELRDVDDLGSLRAKEQDIQAETFQAFLEEGCVVKQLRLNWQEQVTFTMKDDFSFSSIHYLDSVLDQRDDNYTETAADRFDADFAIMTVTLRTMVAELFKVFTPIKILEKSK